MSIEAQIAGEVVNRLQPFFNELLQKIERQELQIQELQKSSEKPLNIKESCELLNNINRDTFRRYRKKYNLIRCGGTEERPLFHRADVLKLKKN